MYRIYYRTVRLEINKRLPKNRFANPVDQQGRPMGWAATGDINSDPEKLFSMINGPQFYDEYDFPMNGSSCVVCNEYQVVNEPTNDDESEETLSMPDFVIKRGYKQPKFK
jgi:hypothetical protein